MISEGRPSGLSIELEPSRVSEMQASSGWSFVWTPPTPRLRVSDAAQPLSRPKLLGLNGWHLRGLTCRADPPCRVGLWALLDFVSKSSIDKWDFEVKIEAKKPRCLGASH